MPEPRKPRLEIQLPSLDGATPRQQLVVRVLADAFAGEHIDWPAEERAGWEELCGLVDQIPGALFAIMLPGTGSITRESATIDES